MRKRKEIQKKERERSNIEKPRTHFGPQHLNPIELINSLVSKGTEVKANGKQLGLWCCRALHFPTSSLRSPANCLRLLSVVPVHWSHLVPPLISFPSLSSGIGSRLDLPRAFHDLTLWLQSLPKRQSAFVCSWIARLCFVVPRKSSPLTLRHILHFLGLVMVGSDVAQVFSFFFNYLSLRL